MRKPSVRRISVAVIISVMVWLSLGCHLSFANAKRWDEEYLPPPSTLQDADIVGTWIAIYSGIAVPNDIERITINTDKSFTQDYSEPLEDYYSHIEGSGWWLEGFADGQIYLHLPGAKFFAFGRDGSIGLEKLPAFYDPVSGNTVLMKDELILNVRKSENGGLLLMQMWLNSESGTGTFEREDNVPQK